MIAFVTKLLRLFSHSLNVRPGAHFEGRKKPKPQQKRGGKVVTGPERLIPIINFSRSRRTRQALLALEGLDPQTRNVLFNLQHMGADEIHGPRKRWSDPH